MSRATKRQIRPAFLTSTQHCLGPIIVLLSLCLTREIGAQTYTVLHTFSTNDGAASWNLLLSGTNFFGSTRYGGHYGNGTIFKVGTDGSDYAVIHHFGIREGSQNTALVQSGSALYGTTTDGGSNYSGSVFKVNTDGSDYQVLYSFSPQVLNGSVYTNADGAVLFYGLVVSGTTLYGTAGRGGHSGIGTVFKLNTDGSGFAVLKDFQGADGASPSGMLLLSGGVLYGTTSQGGGGNYGTLFRMNIDGSGYTILKDFNLTDGSNPQLALVIGGSTIYGTCGNGGAGGYGTIFKVSTDGTQFEVLRAFNGSDGVSAASGLVLSGNTLYGTISLGGPAGYGELFQISTDGTGFAVLKSFNRVDGASPDANLVLDGTTLYSTASSAGRLNNGVAFSFSLLPGPPQPDPFINTQPESRSINAGGAVQFGVASTGIAPLTYQWIKDSQRLINGPGVSGAQTPTLALSNVFHGATGNYWVIISNVSGSATSQVARLAVADPFIDTQPFNQTAYIGQTVQFATDTGGASPLAYQWLKDGIALSDGGNISGSRTPVLRRTNVHNNDSGVYALTISNAYGSLSSSPAILHVVPPVPPPGTLAVAEVSMGSGVAVNVDQIRFSFGQFGRPVPPQFPIFDNFLLSERDVGRLIPIAQAVDSDFNELVSVLRNGSPDRLSMFIGSGGGGSGIANWEYYVFPPVPGGNGVDFQGFPIDNISLLIEELSITHSQTNWTDVIFRGKIFINSEPWPQPIILQGPMDQTAEVGSSPFFSVHVTGAAPLAYQWRLNGTAINGSTAPVLQLSSVSPLDTGAYSVVITNVSGAVTSAPAILNVIAPVERRPVPALTLAGQTGVNLHLENRSALDPSANWLPLDTVFLHSPSQFYFDLTYPLPANGFYRAWQSSGAIGPRLDVHVVPAITLTGSIGSSQRLDFINQFGPIDAWVTNLATVSLTNTSQLYFDTSAIGKPQRLYRIVPVP